MGWWYYNGCYANRVSRRGLDASCSSWGPVVSSCEDGNERSGCMQGGEFFD